MLKHVIFCSRKEAENRAGWADWAVISVSEPEPCDSTYRGPAALKDGWGRVLRLAFHDIDIPEEPWTIFDEKLAREILIFANECAEPDSGITGILVHYRAGISRSAAIALWISEKYKLAGYPLGYSMHNKLVYQILREESMLEKWYK